MGMNRVVLAAFLFFTSATSASAMGLADQPCSLFGAALAKLNVLREKQAPEKDIAAIETLTLRYVAVIDGYLSRMEVERNAPIAGGRDAWAIIYKSCEENPSQKFGDAVAQYGNATVQTKSAASSGNVRPPGSPVPFVGDRLGIAFQSFQIVRCEGGGRQLLTCVVKNTAVAPIDGDNFLIVAISADGVILDRKTFFIGTIKPGEAIRSRPLQTENGNDKAARFEIVVGTK
jgi:hypothetical protein